MRRLAMLSVHADPLGRLGSKETGGMNVYIRELTTELAGAGLGIDVFTRKVEPTAPAVADLCPGARVVRIEAGPVAQQDKNRVFAYLPAFIRGVEHYRRANGYAYSLAHSHYWLSSWVGARLARLWGVAHLTMFHTLGEVKNCSGAPSRESDLRIAVEREVIAAADRIVAASADERGHLVNLYNADPARIEIVPCGVNTRLFRPLDRAASRAKLGLDKEWVLLFVGRMDPLKGVDILLGAAKELKALIPCLKVLIVGGDAAPESEELRVRNLATALGLADTVRFEGAVPQERLPYYYSAADACVVPSYYESFGLVAVEALSCGTPVIASCVGGLPVVVKNGENGLLVGERTSAAFARAALRLCRRPEERARLAGHARASVMHLDWSMVARRILALYRDLMTGEEHQRAAASCQARLRVPARPSDGF